MKKALLAALLIGAAAAAAAQTTTFDYGTTTSATGTNSVNSDTASTAQSSNAGNQQNITFTSPGQQSLSSNETVNTVKSGTDRSVIEYTGSYTLKNTPSVNGGNLTTSNDTCMGSTSGSVNAPGIGIGFGSTWVDENCKRLKMSRELWNKGFRAASLAVDCMTPEAREALELTGTRCPQSMTQEERRAAFGSVSPAAVGDQREPIAFRGSASPESHVVR